MMTTTESAAQAKRADLDVAFYEVRVKQAIEGIDGPAALLLVTFGPVQGFIAAARRTSDLRAGSFLLSALTAAALRVVYDRVGQDATFFPDLASEQDLLDSWKRNDRHLPSELSLPNRFLALVPEGEAETLAEQAEGAARRALAEAVAEARDKFDRGEAASFGWNEAEHFLECAWAARPFDPAENYRNAYLELERAVGGTKALRRFEPADSTGYRGSLVPALGALVPRRGARPAEVNRFWQERQHRGRLRLRAGEQLSAISITKRLFTGATGHRKAEDLFSSTASFAVADYKRDVLERLDNTAVREAVDDFLRCIAPLSDREGVRYTREKPLPLLEESARSSSAGKTASDWAALPGDWLFEDFLTPFAFEREFDVAVAEGEFAPAREALRALRRAADAAKIALPSRYYGLIVYDGDKMGQWLSGKKTDRITPGTHLAISAALGTFARGLVRTLVERQHLGRLVYSGGDDVLCFVSFRDALPLLHMLRAAFSGHLAGRGTPEDPYKVDWTRESGAVWVDGEERQTLGPAATASAGLTLGHQQEPLQNVLARARAAEQLVKRSGRDRFALALGRRSGAPFSAVGVWRDGAVAPDGVLPVVERLAEAFREGHLASGFLYDAVQDAGTFEALPFVAARRDLRYLWGRRTEKVPVSDGSTREAAAEKLWRETMEILLNLPRPDVQTSGYGTPLDPDRQPLSEDVARLRATLRLVHAALLIGKGGDRER